MRSRFVIPLFVFLVLFSSAFCVISAPTIEDVRPQVTAVFQEKVVIIEKYLINTETGKDYVVDLVFSQDEKVFTFMPQKALSNGLHRLTIYASDLVGNSEVYTYDFEVFVPGTRIFLLEPNSIGFANSTTFPVTIYTSRPSICKYTGIRVGDYDDVRLKFFDLTGNGSSAAFVNDHTILAYSVEPDFPRQLYVVCKDDLGRENFEDFTLYADVTAPTLKRINFDPDPIVEYPPAGDLSSMMEVTASEPVQCRYSMNGSTPYEDMVAFEGFDINDLDAYGETDEQLMEFPGDIVKQTFTFYVQCEDRARFRSARLAKTLNIDLTAGLQIHVVSPPAFSGDDNIFLNITTNRRASCLFKALESGTGDPTSFTDPDARLTTPSGDLDRNHFRDLGVKSEGSHAISVRCDVPEGVGLEAMTATKDYTYSIDKTPPEVPEVNATTPVCGNTLSAEFFANDSMSGVALYNWAVGAAGQIFASGNTSEEGVEVSQYNNGSSFELNPDTNYIFSVSAVDAAGNEGKPGVSNQITFDASGTSCDKTPPTITLVKSEMGDSVEITCSDDASGCTSIGSFYGTSYEQPCNSTQYFLDPVVVPLFKTTIVCWEIKDNAGNVAAGSQIVDFNTSVPGAEDGEKCPGGIDGDGDGYGEGCPLGFDCDDTDPDWSVGCPNGCISDLDGDGFGKGCTAGDDCHGRNPNLTTECPNGCLSDNDGDEFGLGCTNGPDCKGDDSKLTINCPNGCVDDNDGDSYGLGCPVGFDCHGEDYNKMTSCANLCVQDTDGDSFGVGCQDGLDCHGRDPSNSVGCDNGCVFDEDGDGYGFGCTRGLDCNGMHPLIFMDCPNGCLSDNDGDGYGWGCPGSDCNDTDPYTNLDCEQTTDCVYDHDGDSYGLGCAAGPDCDDYDVMFAMDNCTMNCTYDEDCNGLPDDWQEEFFNSTVCDDALLCAPDADPDDDGYSNIEEYRRKSNPMQKDEVYVPPAPPSESADEDGDRMPDACERMYGLNPSDPFDADRDPDGDGLNNGFECGYKQGFCTNWLNPTSPDTDNDGYGDGEEVDAGTDPCDPDSHPSAGLFPIILIVLGILMNLGSTGYLIYKNYYIPLVSPPPKPAAVPRSAAGPAAARPAGAPTGARHHYHHVPRHLAPRKPSGPAMSRELLEKELQKRAQEREKILGVFGERKKMARKPSKVMEQLARKPIEVRRAAKPEARKAEQKEVKPEAPAQPDYVNKLTKVVGADYIDKVAGLSKEEADYMGKLAKISKKKEIPMEDDHVSKLARITKKVSDDDLKQKELVDAFKKSDIDNLDSFLTSRKKVDTFIKEQVPEEKGAFDALENLSGPKRKDVIGALDEISSKKAKEVAMEHIDTLSDIGSKAELFRAVKKMSKGEHVDKNVFEVLLSYLLKSGKITKTDVSELLFDLEQQGVMDKKDVSDVLFNIGVKR